MKCEKCGKKHDGEYGSGRFCSEYCARSFSSLNSNNYKKKPAVCMSCGKNIFINKHASDKKSKCNLCSDNITNDTYLNGICNYCGKTLKNKYSVFCNNKCFTEYKYLIYINKWKIGEVSGSANKRKFIVSRYVRTYLHRKYNNKCARCGWNTKNPYIGKVILEIEHIDGDCTNNKEDNLTLLCPNCHSLTKTYKALNRGNGNKDRLRYTNVYKRS